MNPLTEVTDEQKALLQNVAISSMNGLYPSFWKGGRPDTRPNEYPGRWTHIHCGSGEVTGLVDEIGYRADALDALKELVGEGL